MSRRVLIIEDEPNIIESLSWLLGRDGFEVVSEQDGGAALSAIDRDRPDLVILDAMLPQRDGFEILRDIRSRPALSDLPVLMLTARSQTRDRQIAEALGVDQFMTKPFLNSDLVETARRLATRGGRVRPGTE